MAVIVLLAVAGSCAAEGGPKSAQPETTASSNPASSTDSPNTTDALPDAPSFSSSLSNPADDNKSPQRRYHDVGTNEPAAKPYIKFIDAGQPVVPQHSRDKILLGLRETVKPYPMAGWLLSASWSHLINSSPNYGTNSQAFGQRMGAAAALNSSKEIFSDAVLATAFHQDPRYYQLGHSHRLSTRAVYAVTRPIIGRTDGGRTIPNFAYILGTGGAAALTHTYYPDRNVTPGQVMRTWGTSLGGTALGYALAEFSDDILQLVHIGKRN